VGARPSHVAEKKRAPTEGRPYKLGHYKPSSAEGAAQIDYAKRCRPFGPQFHFEACKPRPYGRGYSMPRLRR